jgi:hypothetical protein
MLQQGKVKQSIPILFETANYRIVALCLYVNWMVNSQWLTLKISFSLKFTFFLMNKLTTHLCKTAYARIKALCLYVPVNRMVSIANLILSFGLTFTFFVDDQVEH